MDSFLSAFLQSWQLDPWVVIPLVLTGWIYCRGWLALRHRGARHFCPGQLYAFLAGLAVLFLALASPLETFGHLLLQVHMVQHLLLMVVVPPLIWLGAPQLPLLRGLPAGLRRHGLGPFLQAPFLHDCWHWLTRPVTAWVMFVAATWLWHVPACYEAALRSDGWHYLEHACFLAAGLLFWWPVVQPYPSKPVCNRWLLLPYLILADVQNTAFSALFTFSDRVLYPYYEQVPHIGGGTPLEDQAVAGVIMWVPGSLVFLAPVVMIGARLLYGPGTVKHAAPRLPSGPLVEQNGGHAGSAAVHSCGGSGPLPGGNGGVGVATAPVRTRRIALPLAPTARPRPAPAMHLVPRLLGRFLGWRHARLTIQVPMLLLAGLIIADGLTGPELAPLNLAGVLPWIHWRGLLVLGLLVMGNVFCMGCPFMLPRNWMRRWLRPPWSWPRWLRSKWLAIGLLGVFLWAYEAFALWASPWWTAWIALGYFAAILVIDGLFRGAAFCKYVCPIGQFNFVQALLSPVTIGVRDLGRCESCETKDCIRGGNDVPGCELRLFQPRKAGNLDCTFCLDCIHACPHDNVGLVPAVPGAELWHDRARSGIGRLSRRFDLAALVLVLVFGAFANAAGMVEPVVAWQDRLAGWLGLPTFWIVTLSFIGTVLVLPWLLIAAAALLARCLGSGHPDMRATALRFTYALVPIGCAMWLSHYTFHFFTSAGTAIPVTQRFAQDLGMSFLGAPEWACSCCQSVAAWIPRLELIFLDLGLLLSLYAGYRIARQLSPQSPLRALAPWALLIVLLFAAGVWIVLQPMQMRGTMG